jgi:putative two-component system response regulator
MNKILFVDDEPLLLDSVLRNFKAKFPLETAESGPQGLKRIKENGPFAVVVSDFRMPRMDGVSFMEQVAVLSPATVRIMLTGAADLPTAMRAINEGNIFRFLTKPCPVDLLEKALQDALRQYKLVQTEREYYALKRWNDSLEGLLKALVRLTEAKDPYTAGHQIRVAQLAVAIAGELGLPRETVEEISISAQVHDLGKIYVPAEFLNKPGLLNKLEFEIIRMHSQIGHDILEPVKFAFPIHQIVLQHHERLDGSGYPQGLMGEAILLPARIIAVADVIEAISSHRPYRPAKSLEEALKEISDGQGSRYDSQVVQVTLDLFNHKGFQFV